MTYDDFKAKHKENVLKGFDDIDGRDYWAEFKADLHILLANERKPLELQNDELKKLIVRVYACHQPDVCDCAEPPDSPHSNSCISTKVAEVSLQALTEKRKCPSTYTHSSLGKLTCEKDEAHLHRRGDVEHSGGGKIWMSI